MKKVLSLVLAVVLVLGMSTVAFAAAPARSAWTVDELQKSSNKYLKLYVANSGTPLIADNYRIETDITVKPVIDVDLYSRNVTTAALSDPDNVYASTTDYVGVFVKDKATGDLVALNFDDVAKYDISVKLAASSPIFKGVSLKEGSDKNTVVRFELYAYLDSTSTKSFTDKISLYANDKKMTGTDLEIKGKFKNKGVDLKDEDENELSLDDGSERKLNVKANIRNAELELDYDVFLYTTLYNGRNVYARANNVANNTQFAVMDKYSSIEEVVTLYTAGFTGNTKVFFDRPEKLYVYGVDSSASYDAVADTVKLVYLGTSDKQLPLVDQYFLSTKELVIETTPVEPEPSVPAESSASNPVGGGDTTAPNANYNPGTGC